MTLPLVVVVRVTTPNLIFFLNGAIRVTGHEIPSRGLTVDLLFFPSSRRDGWYHRIFFFENGDITGF
jgi:hypothetical protein